jgi:hypothetical protein
MRLFTASMNTSYSSMARKGLSVNFPRARMNATVVKERSPPARRHDTMTATE